MADEPKVGAENSVDPQVAEGRDGEVAEKSVDFGKDERFQKELAKAMSTRDKENHALKTQLDEMKKQIRSMQIASVPEDQRDAAQRDLQLEELINERNALLAREARNNDLTAMSEKYNVPRHLLEPADSPMDAMRIVIEHLRASGASAKDQAKAKKAANVASDDEFDDSVDTGSSRSKDILKEKMAAAKKSGNWQEVMRLALESRG